MEKTQLRHQSRQCLSEITSEQRHLMSGIACQNLIGTEQFGNASVIMFYLPLPHEADVTGAILHAWQREKTVAVPKVSWQQRHMIPVEINSLQTGLAAGANGLRNPVTGVPTPIEEIDLVVVPGLAFDKNGNRLGRGGCFYDKFLDSELLKAVKCGFAFSCQIADDIPTQAHDIPVDFLITEKGVINCKDNGGK